MALKLINKASGRVISIPKHGTVTLGRGSEIECLDKRISRKHISISYISDHAVLSVLNNNPCFTMKTGSMIHINKKNDKIELLDRDVISLLPDFKSCAFEVCYSSSFDKAPGSPSLIQEFNRPDNYTDCDITCNTSDDVILPVNPLMNNESLNTTSNNYLDQETNEINRPEPAVTPDLIHSSDPSIDTPSNIDNLNENEVTNRPSPTVTPDIIQGAHSPTRIRLASNLFVSPTVNEVTDIVSTEFLGTPQLPSIETSDTSEKMEIKKEKHDSSYFSNPGSPSLMSNPDDTLEATPAKRLALSENIASSGSTVDPPTVMDPNFMVKLEPEVQVNTEPENTPRKRPLCRYGQSCYRKNQQHKTEFSHPGDNDWIPEEQKPLCPFDPNCYRRCPDHRINMRHTCDRQSASLNSRLPNVIGIGSFSGYSSSDYDDDDDLYDEE